MTSHQKKEENNALVFSYLELRSAIGILGMLLPVILFISCMLEGGVNHLQVSISCCYYTNGGDVFVAIVCLLSAFMFTYKGYDWKDSLLSKLAAVCGLGLVFNPTTPKEPLSDLTIHLPCLHINKIGPLEIHLLFAASFFVLLAIMSIVFFTKSEHSKEYIKGTKKETRNRVYKTCGYIMLGCIVVLLFYFAVPGFKKMFPTNFPLIFILETVALWAFGFSWLTKGEAIWADEKTGLKTHLKRFLNI